MEKAFTDLQERVAVPLLQGDYVKELDEVTPQCLEGGNSSRGGYRKKEPAGNN
jgi:hypothetical protein